ncbi:hypothetical protein LINGRAHAP2_LOCUS12211 [Linum grandiflorum]
MYHYTSRTLSGNPWSPFGMGHWGFVLVSTN